MPRVRIYICPEGDNGAELETLEAYTARTRLTRSGDTVSLPMAPVSGPATPRRLVLKLMPHGSQLLCRHSARLTLTRAALAPGGTAADQRQEDAYYEVDELILNHLEARVSHPDHCQWERTYLAASPDGAAPPRALGYSVHAADTLPPAIDARPKAPDDTIFAMNRLELAPGEMAWSMWRTVDSTNVWDTPAAMQWFRTCCLTGGYVRAVHGSPGTPEAAYIVRCQGQDTPCRATDNTAYAIGEWVSVLDTGAGCRACDRTERCPAEKGETAPPSSGIIAPVQMLDHAVSGAFGEYALSFRSEEMRRLLGMCLETAHVLAVNAEADRLDIHVEGEDRVSHVPVHYRCSPEGSTAGGAAAFLPEDIVLVLRIAHTMERVVVGFADGVRPCDVRRSTVLCFLVEKFSCLYGDLAVATGGFDESYGWQPSSWSSHISRGDHIANDPSMDAYVAAYCMPTYESCYEKIYIRVWDDGSVEKIADPAAEHLEMEDCFSATRWRKLIARSDGARCPDLPSYSNHVAVGHELVAPTHQENILLPDGSRLALAKNMAGFAAVLAPALRSDDTAPATLTAYAVHDPRELVQECIMTQEGYTETREICRYRMPEWYSSLTGLTWAAYCGCGGPAHCSEAVDDFIAETGDQVALHHCPWYPDRQYGWDEIFPQWHIFHTECSLLRYHSEQFRNHCECHDVTVAEDTCECVTIGVQTGYVPPSYALTSSRPAAEPRDVVSHEHEITPVDARPLAVTKPLPGSFTLTGGQEAGGDVSYSAAGGWEIPYDSNLMFTDEAMQEAALGCDVTYHPQDPDIPGDQASLKLTTKKAGVGVPEWEESADDELTSRAVDRLSHLVVETTFRKPSESDTLSGRHPVALLARGRVWVPGLENEALQLDVAGILNIIESSAGAQGYDCAVLRPWCCLRRQPSQP